jgi:Bacteriophage tail sheath protein
MTYRTPGVYVEEISVFPPSVAEVETAIPAFIGFTEFAKKDGADVTEPLQITSLKEYEQYFGGPKKEPVTSFELSVNEKQDSTGTATGFELAYNTTQTISHYRLYYAMQMFFANGGGKCYVMSAGLYGTAIDEPKLSAGIDKIKLLDEPTMLVIPEAVSLDSAGYLTVCGKAVDQAHDLKDRFAILDVRLNDPKRKDYNDTDITEFRGLSKENEYLRYGAAYYPYLRTTFGYSIENTDGLVMTTVLLNGSAPVAGAPNQPHIAAGATIGSLKASNNVAYNALIGEVNAKLKVMLPPSSAMAGIYARVDTNRGVWKAPANVGVNNVIGPSVIIDNERQGTLNIDTTGGKSINVIRSFSGRGTIVWGARTLDGNSNEWRYVNVRRFFNMVEESVQKSTVWAVFEPNTKNTWVMVKSMIENYLITKWQEGALAGAKPDDAFFVKIGLGVTMTADDILNGIMNVEIGMAVARPAEFIILKFSHKMQVS